MNFVFNFFKKNHLKMYWFCEKCKMKVTPGFEQEFSLKCNKCFSILDLVYDGDISWKKLDPDLRGVLRYAELIPVSQRNLQRLSNKQKPEFNLPVESKKMAQLLGVESVHLLAPIYGLSGTFKDLEAMVVIGKCLDRKINKRLSWHSTGNTARAYREYAIKANFKSDSYFPLSCIGKFKGIKKNLDNVLIGYNGPFQDISVIAKNKAQQNDTIHLAPLPWKIEGKAILAYNIFENLPDTNVIVQTIAGGYGVLGMELGIKRLKRLKLFSGENYRYDLFQIEGADTITKLMPLNKEITETDLKLPVNPFEPTLQSTNPLSTFNLIRDILVGTGSNINSVTPEEVIENSSFFETECRNLGIEISFLDEKSPFISWAGLVKASNNKKLSKTDRIVIIVTGSKIRTGKIPEPDIIFNL